MLNLFRWLNDTPISSFLRRSDWGFAIIEMVHLVGLAVLGGTVLITNLRFLGVGLRRQATSRVVQELFPVFLVSLSMMLISGGLLLTTWPLRYYYNPAFRAKMLFLFFAIAFSFLFQRTMVKSEDGNVSLMWPRIAAVISLALWLCVGLAGRAIGVL